ncbi:MAG: arginase family protein [Myxococcales bacterium]|nr:arginase family protein [Myxococcales bacterium]
MIIDALLDAQRRQRPRPADATTDALLTAQAQRARPSPQQAPQPARRDAPTSFFRLPTIGAGPGRFAGTDVALLGVPSDAGAAAQAGARLAPAALRRTSARLHSYHATAGIDVFRTVTCADAGDATFAPLDRAAMRAAVTAEVGAIAAAGAVPLVVGGDQAVTVPTVRALAATHGPLAIIHLDAHLDTSGADASGDAWHHRTPMRHLITEGLVAPGQLHHVGVRGSWESADEAALTLGAGNHLFFISELATRGVYRVAGELRERIGKRPAYLSFDIGVVDPAAAPGTTAPVPGGLTSREALALIRALEGVRLVGADLVEIAPALDHADLTAHLGAAILFELMALVAQARDRR